MSPVTQTMSSTTAAPAPVPEQSSTAVADDIGYEFVQKYYHTLHQDPARLVHFYTKSSIFVHAYEKESTIKSRGISEISERIKEIGFNDFKVVVTQVDSHPTPFDGVMIAVLGRLSISGRPFQRFAQSFFLHETSGRWYVSNDNLRFLVDEQEEVNRNEEQNGADHGDDAVTAPAAIVEAEAVAEPEPVVPSVPEPVPAPVEPSPPVETVELPAAIPETVKQVAVEPVPETVEAVTNEKPTPTPSPAPAVEVAATPAPGASAVAATPEKVVEASKPTKPSTWAALAAKPGQTSKPGAAPAKQSPAATSSAPAPRPVSPTQAPIAAAAVSANAPAASAPTSERVAPPSKDNQAKGPKSGPRREESFDRPPKDSRNGVFVRGLRETNVSEDLLKNAFTKYGEVANVRIHGGKRSVIIDFVKPESADAALKDGSLTVEDMTLTIGTVRPSSHQAHPGPARGAGNVRGNGRGGVNNGGNRHFDQEEGGHRRREGDGRGGRGGPRGGRRPSVGRTDNSPSN